MNISSNIGIDLGTSTVLVYVKGKGIILREPSVVAIRNDGTDEIEAIGEKAYEMVGRTPLHLTTIFPLRNGVIADFDMTEKMLRYYLARAIGRPLIRPQVAVCMPCKITEVEQRAIIDTCLSVGARNVHLIEEPVAAALGAGINIDKARGCMVVDIGGGTADIAVISLGGVVASTSIKIAGDAFDDEIIRYIKKKFGLLIGKRTAEEVKIQIGTCDHDEPVVSMDVKGRQLGSGLPGKVEVTSYDICDALSEAVHKLADAVETILEKTPPELSSDIASHGIVMTGGGSLLNGLDRVISKRTHIRAFVADDAISCVAIGTGRYADSLRPSLFRD